MASRGVPNIGQTCWLGAAIQVVLRSPQISRVLLSHRSSSPYLERSADTDDGGIAAAFAGVARAYWRGRDVLPRSPVRDLSIALGNKFDVGRPHDAGEAVLTIVEALHSSFEEIFDSRYENAPSSSYVDDTAWETYNDENKLSIFTEILQNQIEQSIDGAPPVFSHPWAIVIPPGYSIGDGVRAELTEDVDLGGGKTLRKRPRYLAPSMLVVSPTGAPIEEAMDVCGARYELSAAACHSGGHWVTVVKDGDGFSVIDDETVTRVEDARIANTSVCMFVRV
jgi:ubiquitin C-terminal hydrolase